MEMNIQGSAECNRPKTQRFDPISSFSLADRPQDQTFSVLLRWGFDSQVGWLLEVVLRSAPVILSLRVESLGCVTWKIRL